MHCPACVCMRRARNHTCTRTRNFDLPLTRLLSFLLTLLMVFVFLSFQNKHGERPLSCLSLTWGLGSPEPLRAKP